MDMIDLPKQNDGVNYVLIAIDMFSRIAYCQPIKRAKLGGRRMQKCNSF